MVDRTPRRLCLPLPDHWGQFLWGGDESFFDQVIGQTDLEVILEQKQNNCVELLLALYLQQIIIYLNLK